MGDVTRLLADLKGSDPQSTDALFALVYDELRTLARVRLARERPGQTLQATALVHEVYLRLVGDDKAKVWESRNHFLAAAAEAMRRILINRARNKRRTKRGGDRRRLDLQEISVADDASDADLLEIDEALTRLESHNLQAAHLVKLRFFTGITLREAGEALGLPPRTADRLWFYARAWLFQALDEPPDSLRD